MVWRGERERSGGRKRVRERVIKREKEGTPLKGERLCYADPQQPHGLCARLEGVQGYLAHKNPPHSRATMGPMGMVLL